MYIVMLVCVLHLNDDDDDGSEVVRGSYDVLIERRVCLRVKKSLEFSTCIVCTHREKSTGNDSSTRVGRIMR